MERPTIDVSAKLEIASQLVTLSGLKRKASSDDTTDGVIGSSYIKRRACPHGRRKTQCRDCGGTAFCAHGRRKTQCRSCGGSEFCSHDRRKTQCRQCGSSEVCPHGRQKKQCRDCGGSSFCHHGIRKYVCRECQGSGICHHNHVKSKCKKCKCVRDAAVTSNTISTGDADHQSHPQSEKHHA
jgi:hypothetical protein